MPHVVRRVASPHSNPSSAFMAFSAERRSIIETKPPKPLDLARRVALPTSKGPASSRGHMILTVATEPNWEKKRPSDCSLTSDGKGWTCTLVVLASL